MISRITRNPELKFIAVFFFSAAGFMLAIFALAVIVDPYNIFGLNIFRPILLTNRTEKLRLLRDADPKPEAIILGSSRVFKMDPKKVEKLTGLTTFNASVSYARPEEHFAMASYIVNDLGITPKLFIVGVNLGEFNNDETDSQTINNPDLRKYLGIDRKILAITLLRTFKERFNPRYLRDIFVTIFWNSRGFPNPAITFDAAGGQVFDRSHEPNPEDINVTLNLAQDLFRNTTVLNPERRRYFTEFLAFAQKHNVRVTVFLLPFPPEVLQSLAETTSYPTLQSELLREAETWKKEYGIMFFDFSSPEKFGGLPTDFDDATHPSHRNIDLMTERIFKRFRP